MPVPVVVEGGELVIGDDSGTVPVEVGDPPLPVEGTVTVAESSADWLALRGRRSSTCDGVCHDSAGTHVNLGDRIPEGTQLLVETVTLTWEMWCGDTGTDPCPSDDEDIVGQAALQTDFPDFQRHFLGETAPVPGFTGADQFVTANLSFATRSTVSVNVGFPDTPPEGDRIVVNAYVAGRLIADGD